MYNEYPQIQDLYILHRHSMGMSQGEESFLEEILATGDDRQELERRGREFYPGGAISTAGGWRSEHWAIVTNTATVEGRDIYEAQKAEWAQQWKEIDEHPEDNEGWFIAGDRRVGGPIRMRMAPNPELDGIADAPGKPRTTSSYQYIVFDISDNPVTGTQE